MMKFIVSVAISSAVLISQHSLASETSHPESQASATNATPLSRFSQENSKRGRPRMALLWNREFSDSLATTYTDFVRDETRQTASSTQQSDSTTTEFGSAALSANDSSSSSASERVTGSRADRQAGRSKPPESLNWQLQSSFVQQLSQAGARLIDRAIVMRTLNGGSSVVERPDVQSVESSALSGKADLLLEVLLAADPNAPAGVAFQVNIKSVRDGELLASFVTDALPLSAMQGSYRAGATGFEYVQRQASIHEVGTQLATETMRHLLLSWENDS